MLDRWAEDRTEGAVSSFAIAPGIGIMKFPLGSRCNRESALLRKLQLLARRDEAILSGRPAAEVERREILLEGLNDMGRCALHYRLEPAEPHRDQLPNTGLSIRPLCRPP